MLLNDITKIVRVLLGAFSAMASQDEITQRRIGQIGEVIGAVDDVSATEAEPDSNIVDKRVEEAHDIIHRVAAILAMEGGGGDGAGIDEGKGNDGVGGGDNSIEASAGNSDDLLVEVPWDGKIEGETFELVEDEED